MEILGNKLSKFFDFTDPEYTDAEITYADSQYEVWEASDSLFKKMCDMSDDEFLKLAGEGAWWRSADGSKRGVLDIVEGR